MNIYKRFSGYLIAFLPFTLFLPVGIMYACIAIFLITWIVSGEITEKLADIRTNPAYSATIILLAVVLLSAVFWSQENSQRWHGVIHYFVFVFFLFFSSGIGAIFYQRAKVVLFFSAVYAAILLCLAKLSYLPDWHVFSHYNVYSGNKSISIGIFMAVAAAWMMDEAFRSSNRTKIAILLVAYAFVETVVVKLAITRTGTLLVYLLSVVVLLRNFKFNKKLVFAVSFILIVNIGVVGLDAVGNNRLVATMEAMKDIDRRDVGVGETNRLQFFRVTAGMIYERPILGFGIGGWRQHYQVRADGLETAGMSTPHNDYLLYTSEMGIIGLLALVFVLFTLFGHALRSSAVAGNGLLIVVLAIIVASMFNAILRDLRFGVPMMLMLAIAYRQNVILSGQQSQLCESAAKV